MIVCKPKSSVLFSLGTFALLCYGCLLFLVLGHASSATKPFYFYPLVFSLAGGALFLTYRIVFGYKVITADKGKIEVRQKFLLRDRKFDLRHLVDTDEVVIKTMNGDYSQLTLVFSNGTLKISRQEYSDYDKLKSYVGRNWKGSASSPRRK
jgi:hypothetical protein